MASRVVVGAVTALGICCSASGWAQDGYPTKVIRIVAPAAGGGSDAAARMIAPGLSASLGQQVIVDNRGAIAAEIVAKAPPDGYTLLVDGSPLWLLPLFRPGMQWDAVRDFAPITMALSSPSILVVHPSVPVKTVKELIAMAKARPGQLNYAAGTIGATPHLAAELFKAMANVDMVRVAYKGTGPGVIGLLGGEVELMFPNAGSALPHIHTKRLRALAVCSAEPSALVPGMPTLSASVPGYESISPQGVVAPAKTPAPIVNRLHQEIVRVLTQPDMRQKLLNSGAEVAATSPEEFSAKMKADIARTVKLIKERGVRDD